MKMMSLSVKVNNEAVSLMNSNQNEEAFALFHAFSPDACSNRLDAHFKSETDPLQNRPKRSCNEGLLDCFHQPVRLIEEGDQNLAPILAQATISFNLAIACSRLGHHDDVEANFSTALSLLLSIEGSIDKSSHHASELAIALYSNLGCICLRQARYEESVYNFIKALQIVEKAFGVLHVYHASVLNCIAMCYFEMGNQEVHDKVCGLYGQFYDALLTSECDILPENPSIRALLADAGDLCYDIGKYEAALEMYMDFLLSDHRGINRRDASCIKVLSKCSRIHVLGGDYGRAHDCLNIVLDVQRSIEQTSDLEIASTLSSMGCVQEAAGHYESAVAFFEESLSMKIQELCKNNSSIASNLHDVEIVQREERDLCSALKLFEACLEIHDVSHDQYGMSADLFKMGSLYLKIGREKGALSCWELLVSFELRSSSSDTKLLASCLEALGVAEKNFGNYNDAITRFNEALDLIQGSQDDFDNLQFDECEHVARLYRLLGDSYIESGDTVSAARSYSQLSRLNVYNVCSGDNVMNEYKLNMCAPAA